MTPPLNNYLDKHFTRHPTKHPGFRSASPSFPNPNLLNAAHPGISTLTILFFCPIDMSKEATNFSWKSPAQIVRQITQSPVESGRAPQAQSCGSGLTIAHLPAFENPYRYPGSARNTNNLTAKNSRIQLCRFSTFSAWHLSPAKLRARSPVPDRQPPQKDTHTHPY